MIETALWLILQVTGILWFSTLLFDGLHFLLHRWRYSQIPILRWAAGLHQVHHDFLDKRMQVNLSLRRANIIAHILPEFIVTVAATAPFALIFPLAAGLVLFRHCYMLVYTLWLEGVDAHHMAMDRLDGRLPAWKVNASYHALHHINPLAYYSSIVRLFDAIFGTAISLNRKYVVITGTGAFAMAMAKRLRAAGCWVRMASHNEFADGSVSERLHRDLETAEILVLAHGSREPDACFSANAASNMALISIITAAQADRLVPPEVWGIGSEAELFGRDSYAQSKRAFAAYAAGCFDSSRLTYRHIVPSSFRSAMSPRAPMSADFAAATALFLIKRGFRYVPVTWTGLAILNWFRFRFFAAA